MNKLASKSFSIWILNFIVNLSFWLVIIGLVFTGALLMMSLAGVDLNRFVIEYSFPIHFDLAKAGIIKGTEQTIGIARAAGNIQVGPGKQLFTNQLLISMLLVFAILFLIVGYSRNFMKNIRAGEFFIMENMVLLRKVSYAILGLWLVNLMTKIWLTIQVNKLVVFDNINLRYDFNDDIRLLLFPAALLMLTNIFAEGIRLKSEQDLTV